MIQQCEDVWEQECTTVNQRKCQTVTEKVCDGAGGAGGIANDAGAGFDGNSGAIDFYGVPAAPPACRDVQR